MAGDQGAVPPGSLGGWVTAPAPAPQPVAASGTPLYQLADDYQMTSSDALDVCDAIGIAADSGTTMLSGVDVTRFRAAMAAPAQPVAPPVAQPVAPAPPPPPGADAMGPYAQPPGAPPRKPSPSQDPMGYLNQPLFSATPTHPDEDRPPVDTSRAKVHPLLIASFALCWLPLTRAFIPWGLGVIPVLVFAFVTVTPSFMLAEKAEDHILDSPERWKSEHLVLVAKAMVSLALVFNFLISLVKFFIG